MKKLSLYFLFTILFSQAIQAESLKNRCPKIIYSELAKNLNNRDYNLICGAGECSTDENAIRRIDQFFQDPKPKGGFYSYFLTSPWSVAFSQNPWWLSKIQHESYREIGFVRGLVNSLINIPVAPRASLSEIYSTTLTNYSLNNFEQNPLPAVANPLPPEEIRRILNTYSSDRNQETRIVYDAAMLAGACAMYAPIGAIDCTANLNRLVKLFNTGPSFNLASPYLTDILTSAAPARGARHAVQKIVTRLTNGTVGGDVFSDIYQSYLETGYSAVDAEKWTWDLIFLAFIHGQNGYALAVALRQPYNIWALHGAMVISSASALLDSINLRATGKMYSLPANVDSGCDNGKPYHFWVPAYAARESISKGYSRLGSGWAPFLMNFGYQLFSKSNGRDPSRYLNSPPDAAVNSKNRMDLAYTSAGIAYALNPDQPISINESFDRSLEASEDFSRQGNEGDNAFERGLKFKKLMQPSILYQASRVL